MTQLLGRKRPNKYYRSHGGNYEYSEEEQGAIGEEEENRSKGNYRHNKNYLESSREKRTNDKDPHQYFRRNYNASIIERNQYNQRSYENEDFNKDKSYIEDRKSNTYSRNYNESYVERRSHHNNRDESMSKERLNESRKREVVRDNTSTHISDEAKHKSRENSVKKNSSFLIILPKNYMRFLNEEYERIYKDIKVNVRDIRSFNQEYSVSGFKERVLKIDASTVSSKSVALKIFADYIYKYQKSIYSNLTYIKISILVPSHVVGFIIGIDGKNINKIREISNSKIDIKSDDIGNKYRQIELAGKSVQISRAAERIYRIVNKYYFHNIIDTSNNLSNGRLRLRKSNGVDRKSRINKKKRSLSKERIISNFEENEHSRKNRYVSERRLSSKKENYKSYGEKSSSSSSREKSHKNQSKDSPILKSSDRRELTNLFKDKVNKKIHEDGYLIKESILDEKDSLVNKGEKKEESGKQKVRLQVIVSNKFFSQNPQYLKELEKSHSVDISFKTEQLLNYFSKYDNDILTFHGIPEQNSKALLKLQQDLLYYENSITNNIEKI